MNNQHKINRFRRIVMRRLTQWIGSSEKTQKITPGSSINIKRILIIRPNNRLGNLLLVTPLLRELEAVFPDCKTDLFVRGNLAPILFEKYPSVKRIIKLPGKPFKHLINYAATWLSLRRYRYDLVINVMPCSSSGRLSTKFSSAKYKLFGDAEQEEINNEFKHNAKYPLYTLRKFLSAIGIDRTQQPIPLLDIRLDAGEAAHGRKVLESIVPQGKPVISFFTYATGGKCYSEDWWDTFYNRLIQEFSNYDFIEILPAENVSQVHFRAPSLYSRDIREIAGVIASTSLFIGADSGIMHLASASGTPTIGLFSVTDSNAFRPYGNNSTIINTNCGDIDSWIAIIRNTLEKQNLLKPNF
ncbi:ADP-heptose--LPS heptosyltransferase [Flavobacterium cyanobacteriorum]|uniref:ADP-heptose--LPS heptosyltransferase n=1 Tax=Flavobacterium cyanobacteriorum TaxID=2022802 RepID=A0A255Z8C8_9FLAO|nr:ADP-heptose--LPS heptosyltransferase [Flavobacterium cyanobacteriorum]